MTYEIDHFPGRRLQINEENYLYFGGTSYLGLQTDKAFQELFIANIKKYGTNYGASRKSNVRLQVFEEVEAYLAALVGSEACITLSSGYLAGQFMANYFAKPEYTCFYAPRAHSALFTHNAVSPENYTELLASVQHVLLEKPKCIPVVFLDSIDFSGINYPDFEYLKKLPLHRIILVVDDSHGIGIVGDNGSGVFKSLLHSGAKELLVCCSLGKGLGIQAGAIFGSKDRIGQFTHTDYFGGASPATPAAMATLLKARSIYKAKRVLLQENIALFKSLVEEPSRFTSMPKHPTFNFSDEILTKKLEHKNIIITNFRYPNGENELMSRIVISAGHKEEDIQLLCGNLNTL